jgi:hypothetical protein
LDRITAIPGAIFEISTKLERVPATTVRLNVLCQGGEINPSPDTSRRDRRIRQEMAALPRFIAVSDLNKRADTDSN